MEAVLIRDKLGNGPRPHQKMVAEFTVAEFSGCPVFRCLVYRLPLFYVRVGGRL